MTTTFGAMHRAHARRGRPEYLEQSAVINLYGSIGASVYVRSVYGAHPKGVTPGQPDLCIKQPDWRLAWEQEVKPAGKRQSKAQYDYMRECQAMGSVVVLGGLSEAIDFLDFIGIVATRLTGTVRFKPRDEWPSRLMIPSWQDSEHRIAENWYASEAFARQLATFGYKPSAK